MDPRVIGHHIKMYYAEYNPTLHDIYLYDASNTGYPIAINPNSLIAGASADFASVQIRQRRLSVADGAIEIKSPPPGTSITYYPNYYNTNIPLNIIISDKIIGTNVHYSANIPSDSFSPAAGINEYAKYTSITKWSSC